LDLHSISKTYTKFCCLPISCLSIPSQQLVGCTRELSLFAAALCLCRNQKFTHLVRVEMDLKVIEPDAIREYARRRRIHQIAWIKAEGLPVIEPLTQIPTTESFWLG